MAIIYSYPPNSNILPTDILVCTSTVLVGGKPKNQTKSLSIANLSTYIITSTSNNLNQVLTNGNTSLLDAKIGELYLYDNANGGYAKISIQDDYFSVSRATSGTSMFYVDNGTILSLDNGVGQANILNNLTTTRTYALPDKSGIIALTSDFTGYVPYTGATGDINIGGNSIYTSGGAKLWDDGTVEGTSFQFVEPFSSYLSTSVSAPRNWVLPNASGTIALTSNIGIVSLNGLAVTDQEMKTGAAGTDFGIVSTGAIHTFNLPDASTAARGIVTVNAQSFSGLKNFTNNIIANTIKIWRGSNNSATNIGIGLNVLDDASGSQNTVIGYQAVSSLLSTSSFATAVGYQALFAGKGNQNTAIGWRSLYTNTGSFNTALGYQSLLLNSAGAYNTAVGNGALYNATLADRNTAIGYQSLYTASGGLSDNNVAIGHSAGFSITSGSNNVMIGYAASPLAPANNNSIVIGASATGVGSNSVVLGNASILTTVLRGNVGIGTTVPQSNLHVVGNGITLSTADVTYGFGSIKTVVPDAINYPYEGDMVFSCFRITGGIYSIVENLRIVARTGNVGIGTPTPAQKLDVVGNIKASGSVQVGPDPSAVSAANVGAIRYRTSGNNSYMDMVMQTGAATYAWVNVKQNNW